MDEVKCKVCRDTFEPELVDKGVCRWCREKTAFSKFAKTCGLTRYPAPSGERYVYKTNGDCDGKKGECTDLMDELWNALVRAKNGDESLIISSQ